MFGSQQLFVGANSGALCLRFLPMALLWACVYERSMTCETTHGRWFPGSSGRSWGSSRVQCQTYTKNKILGSWRLHEAVKSFQETSRSPRRAASLRACAGEGGGRKARCGTEPLLKISSCSGGENPKGDRVCC